MIYYIEYIFITRQISQSVGSPNAMKQIVKSFFFFVITNLEAFLFCYVGEYLTNKVSNKNNIYNKVLIFIVNC